MKSGSNSAPNSTKGGYYGQCKNSLEADRISKQASASTQHISRNSVSEVFRIADEKEILYADVRNLGENEVYRIIYPDKHQEEVMFEAPDYGRVHIVV
mgnify:CR=1 FL=1